MKFQGANLIPVLSGLLITFYISIAQAQFDTVINAPPTEVEDAFVLESNTQLNVFDNGIVGNFLRIGAPVGQSRNIEVNLFEGEIGSSMNAFAGSTVNVFGGSLGSFSRARDGSQVNILGGEIGLTFFCLDGSIVSICGGEFQGFVTASIGSNLDISGGKIPVLSIGSFSNQNLPPANVRISGGAFGDSITMFDFGELTLVGGEFELNGKPFSELTLPTLDENDIFTAILEDGSPFFASPLDRDLLLNVNLKVVDIPPVEVAEFIIDGLEDKVPLGLRIGQCLTLREGGNLPENFTCVGGVIKNEGGFIGNNLDLIDAIFEMSGGSNFFGPDVFGNSVFELNGGQLGSTDFFNGATANINGGSLSTLQAFAGSSVFVTGGQSGCVSAQTGALVQVSGGNFRYVFENGSTGNFAGGFAAQRFFAREGSQVTLNGGEFLLNGVQPQSPDDVTLVEKDVLTGTLEDGTVFVFSPEFDELISVTLNKTMVPPNDNLLFVVDEQNEAPLGLRANQQLRLKENGRLPDNFAAVDAELTIEGGIVGLGLEVVDTEVKILAGDIGSLFAGYRGSVVNILGGQTGFTMTAAAGSYFNICGGRIGRSNFANFGIRRDSIVDISGGEFGPGLQVEGNLNYFGTEFLIDGVPIEGLVSEEAFEIKDRDVNLSGRLTGGQIFSLDLNSVQQESGIDFVSPDAILTVTLTNSLIRGDVNKDGAVDLLDVAPLLETILQNVFIPEADINKDGTVDLSDIPLFVNILTTT